MTSISPKSTECLICKAPIPNLFKSGTVTKPIICSRKQCKEKLVDRQNPELAEARADINTNKEQISIESMMESRLSTSSNSQDGEKITQESLEDSVIAYSMDDQTLKRLEEETKRGKTPSSSQPKAIADSQSHSDDDIAVIDSKEASGEEDQNSQAQYHKKHRTLSATETARHHFSSLISKKPSTTDQK